MTGASGLRSPASDVRPAPLLVGKMKNRPPEVKLDGACRPICLAHQRKAPRTPVKTLRFCSTEVVGKKLKSSGFRQFCSVRVIAPTMIAVEAVIRRINEYFDVGLGCRNFVHV